MKIIVYNNIKKIKDIYEKAYRCFNCASPYLSYSWLKNSNKGFRDLKPLANFRIKKRIYILYDDINNIKCIAPLLINANRKEKTICIWGTYSSSEPLDFLYSEDINDSEFSFLFDKIHNDYPKYRLSFLHIYPISKLAHFIKSNFSNYINCEITYRMNVNNYNNWYDSLSKSAKQNIRTSYNRIKRDGKTVKLEFNTNWSLSISEYFTIIRIFSNRLAEHMKINSCIIRKVITIGKLFNIVSIALNRSENNYYAILYLDSKIIGFSSGLFNNNRICVNRFAIDSKYARYSPGAIIHNELIKVMSETKFIDGKEYIFSVGDEDYKLRNGGECFEYYALDYYSRMCVEENI